MDVDSNQIEVQLVNMEIGETSGAASLLEHRKNVVKKNSSEVTEAFKILNDEIDSRSILPALKAHFVTKLGERYMNVETFIDLLNNLLELEHRNYKGVIIQLYEALENTAEQIAGRIEDLYKKYKDQKSRIGDDRPLFGRDDELRTLNGHLQTEHIRVINICGMAGIGKSQLVKQLVWTLEDCTYYADCRGVRECGYVVSKLLADIGKNGGGSVEDMKSALLSELKNRGDSTLIVIDDITGLTEAEKVEGWMSQTSSSKSEKIVLLEVLQLILKYNDRVRVIITSQEAMEVTENSEANKENEIMRKFNDCWVDMKLDRISKYEDCLKIVAPGLKHISRELETLINKCHGHPYSLNLLMTYVQDMGGTMGGAKSLLSQEELVEGTELSFKQLFMNVFNKLNKAQIEILETLSIFPNEVTIKDLYETHYLGKSTNRLTIELFYEKLRTDFSSNFLIDFVKSGFERKISSRVVKCYHPSVRFHVENLLRDDQSKHVTTVRKFVSYHIGLMADLGKKCIHSKRYASNDVYMSAVSISHAIRYLGQTPFCDLLPEKLNASTPLLIHLIIFLDNYHDLFTRPMADLFESLLNFMSTTSNVHLYLLTVFICKKKQNYQTMKSLLSPQERRDPQYNPALKFLMNYSDAFFHLNAPWLLESNKSVEDGLTYLKHSKKFIRTVTDEKYVSATKYFQNLILLDMANGYFTRSFLDRDNKLAHLKQAMSLTIKCEKGMINDEIYILKARMLEYQGLFMSVQGDNDKNYQSAFIKYKEASSHYEKAEKELKDCKRQFSKQSGSVKLNHAILIRSRSNLISEQKTRSADQQRHMIDLLYDSIKVAKESLSIFKNFGTDALKERIRAEVCLAKTYDRCLVEERGLDADVFWRYLKTSINHWNWVYNTLLQYVNSPMNPVEEDVLRECTEEHLYCLQQAKYSTEKIDKIRQNYRMLLEKVQDATSRAEISGSPLSTDSELEENMTSFVKIIDTPQISTDASTSSRKREAGNVSLTSVKKRLN